MSELEKRILFIYQVFEKKIYWKLNRALINWNQRILLAGKVQIFHYYFDLLKISKFLMDQCLSESMEFYSFIK